MIRLRTLVFLLPMILAVPASHASFAASHTSESPWKPGTYLGRITIAANIDHVLRPLPEGTIAEEYHLRIVESTGTMQVRIGSNGNISFRFSVEPQFTYSDWSESKDVGSGGCLGQRSNATGHGTLRLIKPSSLTPVGDKFSGAPATFRVSGFAADGGGIGPNCPPFDARKMRDAIEEGYREMFGIPMEFEVLSPTDRSMAGTCSIPGREYDPEAIFVCTWYVHLAPTK